MPEVNYQPPAGTREARVCSAKFLRDFQLVCPRCKAPRAHDNVDPFVNRRWRNIKCTNQVCGSTCSAKNWFCQCNRLWYGCPHHCDWTKHVKCVQMAPTVVRTPRISSVLTSDMHLPVLSGTRRWRARLSPRKRSTSTPKPPVVGSASSAGRRKPTRRHNHSYRVGGLPFVSGRSCANSSSPNSDGHQERPQGPSSSSGFHPTATHVTFSACSSGHAIGIGLDTTPEDFLPQDLSTRHNYVSSTQALLNACPSGRAVQTRQARRPASGESTLAESKRRKLGGQPYVAPSPELLAKLAMKFPHLRKHPKGDS